MSTAQLTVIVQLTVDTEQAPSLTARLVDTLRTAVDLPIDRMVVDGAQVPEQRALPSAQLRIQPDARRVTVRDTPVELTRLEFDLLLFLCRNPGRVHRRSTILAEVWGVADHLGTRTVDVHVRRLRGKIGFDPITTVRGVGYLVDQNAGFAIERV
ncbi:DNA-binding response OmpR family regulator [Kibdelosporangium banguiense]|uniref:DNA-binding response OmpR family regulator n=1 Tax=Kibdelosporangium banguiense TaxID=1365924 RepID=A0ABS4TGQ9_9PSEU|nr:winged helix-turn-helix domain-containing protein [Kibdelosporangium banguiense]MBP2323569.1 DNA-binding response OmpR family regulator [Kibdelosporangium banguiense]